MIVLIVRLLAFAMGGAVSAWLRVQRGWSMLWCVTTGITVYVAAGFLLEYLLFGRMA